MSIMKCINHQGCHKATVPDRATRKEALEAHTAALTAILEGHVRRYPEQWLWLHRRWKGPAPRVQIARRSNTPA